VKRRNIRDARFYSLEQAYVCECVDVRGRGRVEERNFNDRSAFSLGILLDDPPRSSRTFDMADVDSAPSSSFAVAIAVVVSSGERKEWKRLSPPFSREKEGEDGI